MSDPIYHFVQNGQAADPVPLSTLTGLIQSGALAREVMVWTEGMADWQPYQTLFPQAPPPLPGRPQAQPRPQPQPQPWAAEIAEQDLTPPPGERASWHCGLWALICLIICFPIGIILGIIAIVQGSKAQRLGNLRPRRYRSAGRAGLVMGIVALAGVLVVPVGLGVTSAIAIPALIGQRERARSKSLQALVSLAASECARVNDAQLAAHPGQPNPDAVIAEVLAMDSFRYPAAKNPYGGEATPYLAGPAESSPGQVYLTAVPQYRGDDAEGKAVPAVVITGCYKDGARIQTVERVVLLN